MSQAFLDQCDFLDLYRQQGSLAEIRMFFEYFDVAYTNQKRNLMNHLVNTCWLDYGSLLRLMMCEHDRAELRELVDEKVVISLLDKIDRPIPRELIDWLFDRPFTTELRSTIGKRFMNQSRIECELVSALERIGVDRDRMIENALEYTYIFEFDQSMADRFLRLIGPRSGPIPARWIGAAVVGNLITVSKYDFVDALLDFGVEERISLTKILNDDDGYVTSTRYLIELIGKLTDRVGYDLNAGDTLNDPPAVWAAAIGFLRCNKDASLKFALETFDTLIALGGDLEQRVEGKTLIEHLFDRELVEDRTLHQNRLARLLPRFGESPSRFVLGPEGENLVGVALRNNFYSSELYRCLKSFGLSAVFPPEESIRVVRWAVSHDYFPVKVPDRVLLFEEVYPELLSGLNSLDENGHPPILRAIEQNNPDLVFSLLTHGTEIHREVGDKTIFDRLIESDLLSRIVKTHPRSIEWIPHREIQRAIKNRIGHRRVTIDPNCAVCLNPIGDRIEFNCGHTNCCRSCYYRLEKEECPICRTAIETINQLTIEMTA